MWRLMHPHCVQDQDTEELVHDRRPRYGRHGARAAWPRIDRTGGCTACKPNTTPPANEAPTSNEADVGSGGADNVVSPPNLPTLDRARSSILHARVHYDLAVWGCQLL